jgi:predicted O-methyltransferase YrrM
VFGSGAGAQIRQLEATEGIIFDGVGSTRNVAFREDYGQPTLIASAAGTYDQIFVDVAPRNLPSAVPTQSEQRQIQRILIAAPSGGTLNSTLQTVFAV